MDNSVTLNSYDICMLKQRYNNKNISEYLIDNNEQNENDNSKNDETMQIDNDEQNEINETNKTNEICYDPSNNDNIETFENIHKYDSQKTIIRQEYNNKYNQINRINFMNNNTNIINSMNNNNCVEVEMQWKVNF